MIRTYKYRVYPNDHQKNMLERAFGCARFVYNLGLETKISVWTSRKIYLNSFDLNNQLVEIKKNEAPWLSECPSQALQMSLRNLDNAYTNFFKRGAGFPKFKSKKDNQIIHLPQGVKISYDDEKIFIPKIKWVSIDLHRYFQGIIKTVSIFKSKTNKYYALIRVESGIENKKIKNNNIRSVGVDLGINNLMITSDGIKFDNQKFYVSSQKLLRKQNRSLSRKKVGSNSYRNEKNKLALLHEKIKNRRLDYLHKITKYLVDNYDIICIENLATKNMMKNQHLAKHIQDVGWGKFKELLEYKCKLYNKKMIVIGRFYPSSKLCSNCGYINRELKLSDRCWKCNKCDTNHDRDINAAINIKNFGLGNMPNVS